MLRSLVPESGQIHQELLQDDQLRKQIRAIVENENILEQLQTIANSRTTSIWRIKRAKIILHFLKGEKVEPLVMKVRVPPETIIKCLNGFIKKGKRYFDHPDRKPTNREAAVELLLAFLETHRPSASKKWDTIKIRYIGHDFSARRILKIRQLIESHPDFSTYEIARVICNQFDFRQANGNIKLTQTYQILRRMEMDNVITLPKPNKRLSTYKKGAIKALSSLVESSKKIFLQISDIKQLQFIPVLNKQDSILWRYLVKKYHYIKGRKLFKVLKFEKFYHLFYRSFELTPGLSLLLMEVLPLAEPTNQPYKNFEDQEVFSLFVM